MLRTITVSMKPTRRGLPIVGTRWETLFQDVQIVPSLFSKKEK